MGKKEQDRDCVCLFIFFLDGVLCARLCDDSQGTCKKFHLKGFLVCATEIYASG